MLSLTRKSDYALVAMAYLSSNQQVTEEPVSARQIAKAFALPQPLLMNILKTLAGGGLLESTRGIHGGYRLGRDPRRITMLEVVQLIEGDVHLAPCTHEQGDAEHTTCCAEATCPIRHGIHRLHERLNGLLATMTVADLLEPATDAHQHVKKNGTACCDGHDQLVSNVSTQLRAQGTVALTQTCS